ncbi:MAG: cupin domain-containing protein [Aggregatilineales bacterium]
MRSTALFDNLVFHDDKPYSEPLYVDNHGRILRFMLKPGQVIKEHRTPTSPFYVTILKGEGIFTDGEGQEHKVVPNDFLVFDAGEKHSVRAGDNEFIFLGILQSAPNVRSDHVSGTMVRNTDTVE